MAKNTQEAADSVDNPDTTVVSKIVNVRVLSDVEIGGVKLPCNRVVALDSVLAETLVESGIVDIAEDAVAYALSENASVIEL
ncbi:hypothetical protein [Methylobacter sp. S3L5C]|uniref:hypothetical protein n=1 Tax=Methylobacter sp. S3L5C TaxID=2839024 RepID=UPI001FACA62D|nr:hypothetical protein [Methylobacter sp. S3L5C]UOA08332.1 hypothetical protein KKZ03_19350 [Methylobacter sp. S3L5C]